MRKHYKEIELRGTLEKKQYLNLIKKLDALGYVHEKDNKLSYFFMRQRGILKLNDEISKNQTKLSLKLGDEEKGKLYECEVVLARHHFKDLLFIFKALGFTKFHKVIQKRDNFILNDYNVELSLKHTPDFQYHFEIEYLGNKIKSDRGIKKYLHKICAQLGIKPMKENELLLKIQEIKKEHKLY